MKEYSEMLLSNGHIITDSEFINYNLDGLDIEYDPIIAI